MSEWSWASLIAVEISTSSPDWCDLIDPYAGYLETTPEAQQSTAKPPIKYGRNWPHADAWIDPGARTVHTTP